MQSTQFINSVGQMGVRNIDNLNLTAGSALPGLTTFQYAYDDGQIELDKFFVVRVALDDDNWYIAKVKIESDPVLTLVYEEGEGPSQGSVPDSSVVEIRGVLSAGQLNDAFNDPAALQITADTASIPYTHVEID